ncbi:MULTISPECIES: YggS family pyridoxal phosphate-dependent enzyme [Halobacillus]|uniref:YggS family pyridoxal phosphate-dependent enzyme n=1 Tax=Halobacillus TaxID=45667 RepID=UPI00136D21B7|nr:MULTISPECIES: YggS family pyridoxal phosphate-dependent enzyme [Halobacillus]MYL28252.1 YggS family pyridoxal phosphate-dependent enzyme [Halobacillus halophilus]MYL37817.1 YggS family pyridoxal phosphate-dependent enzyme [Halobacillus litoralis]
MSVAENLAQIKENIEQACQRCGRDPKEVSIVAVTKYVSVERAQEALDAGLCNLGENRKEGLLEKYEAIGAEATWHFIGSLQSRKVKEVIDYVSMIHSLDRRSLAKEIDKRASATVPCFVQVNISGEDSKHGLPASEVEGFVEAMEAFPNVKIVGLMTMAPHIEDEERLRGVFRQLRAVRDRIRNKGYAHAPCEYLSMGMSNDYALAVEEGATHIRLGSCLVGGQ